VIFADAVATDVFRAVLQGTPPGAVYALIALGFVLTYKTSGVFNLAFGAQAYVSALAFFTTRTKWEWGVVPAFVVSVVLLAPLLGFTLEWLVFRHLRTAPAVAKLVVAIGMTLALPNIAELVLDFAQEGRTPEGIVPRGDLVFYDPFGVYSFSRDELAQMVVGVVALVALGALFRYSAIGLRMRAVVESPRMTELNGIAADRVSAFAWALSSFFAGLAGVLIAPRFNQLAAADFFNLVVVAVAAAAVGQLVSMPRALAGGLGLGIFIALLNTFLPKWSDDWTWLALVQENVTPAAPFIVLFGVLVLVPGVRRSRESADPLAGVDPPAPAAGAALGHDRRLLTTQLAGTLALVAVFVVVFTRADPPWLFLVTQAVVMATVFLSITVITGLAGQISLCQGTFAAIGAFTVFQLADRQGVSSITGAFAGAAVAAAVGAALSIPIRRLSGIWVAIATLAFAFFFDAVMVKFSWVGGQATEPTDVPRPVIGPWDLTDDKAFLALALVFFVVVSLAVTQVTAGTTGQKLWALRGSEVAAQSIGISPARMRMAAFALSGFVAGLGGALLAIHQENVNYTNNFSPFGALFWLVLVMAIGARSVRGAATAGGAFALFDTLILRGTILGWVLRSPDRIPDFFPVSPKWRFVLFGLGTIQFARHPEGAVEAQRRKKLAARAERERSREVPAPVDAGPVAGVEGAEGVEGVEGVEGMEPAR